MYIYLLVVTGEEGQCHGKRWDDCYTQLLHTSAYVSIRQHTSAANAGMTVTPSSCMAAVA